MTNWKQFLTNQGERTQAEAPGQRHDMGVVLGTDALAAGFISVVADQGLIAVSGDDAASFLHKQLTNDIEHLAAGEVRLAAYCTPKGRMQASFLLWRDTDAVMLQLPKALLPALQKRLQMFVMRDKAKLADMSEHPDNAVVLGLGGAAAPHALQQLFATLPAAPYTLVRNELGTLMRLADAFGAPRYQWLTSPATALAAWPQLTATLAPGGTDAWNLSAIHAGTPHITARTQEQFVPQMVNFELLGGVNFKKGCYPGQEIVARSQYLGKLKRRTALARIAQADVAAGDEVFAAADPDQPCGMVVNAAPNGMGGVDALVEIKLAALDEGAVHLGSASGAALTWLPMPYALDALEL
jgi:folate-binding protein YgfZ